MQVQGYVEVVEAFDAAHCPDPVPDGYRACMVYAGGSSATHAWTQAELDRAAHLPRLPVWVPTPGHEDPHAVADQLLAWLAGHKVPQLADQCGHHTFVMWDMETGKEPDAAWLNRAADRVAAHGYRNLVYGSISTLFGQPARSGYIVANPTGRPHFYQHPEVEGTQYAWNVKVPGGTIDQDLFSVRVLRQLWQPAH